MASADKEEEVSDLRVMWKMFDKKAKRFLPAREVADFLGVEPAQVALAGIVFLLSFLLFGIGGNLITQLVGFVYPAYESFKALEPDNEKRENPRMMRTWLTYWIVYSLFSVFEVFVDYILYWVPLYYLLKLVFLVWLMIPKLGGAELVYKMLIEPSLRQYRKRIDHTLENAHDGIKKVVPDAQGLKKQLTAGAAVAAAGLASAAAKNAAQ